jgi:predicted aspartyl protease
MTCPSITLLLIAALTFPLTIFQSAHAQQDLQPLAATKLARLLRIPTIALSADAGDCIVALDTGAAGVALDPRFALMLADDRVEIPLHGDEMPLAFNIAIGKLSAKVSQVTILDLSDMRQHLSKPVVGIVGMSVLRDACLRCDFDKEQLLLLSKATFDKAETAELFFAESGRPHVVLSIGRQSFPVMIDLGSELGLEVPAEAYDALESPELRTIAPSMTSNGVRHNRGYKSATVKLGGLQMENVSIAASDEEYGVAGQKFLCRLNFELDFPRKRMHFQPSKRLGGKDNDVRFGLTASAYDGAEVDVSKVVAFVAKGSAAQTAGIRPGDLLLSASSDFYGHHKQQDLYRMLGLPRLGPTMLEVLRDGKPLRFTLD